MTPAWAAAAMNERERHRFPDVFTPWWTSCGCFPCLPSALWRAEAGGALCDLYLQGAVSHVDRKNAGRSPPWSMSSEGPARLIGTALWDHRHWSPCWSTGGRAVGEIAGIMPRSEQLSQTRHNVQWASSASASWHRGKGRQPCQGG